MRFITTTTNTISASAPRSGTRCSARTGQGKSVRSTGVRRPVLPVRTPFRTHSRDFREKRNWMTDAEFATLRAAIRRELESQEFMRLVGAEVVDVAPGEVTLALDR